MRQPKKSISAKVRKPKVSVSAILLGDTLGDLVAKLDNGDNDARLIVILVGPDGVRLAASENLSHAEIIGSLYLALYAE